MAGGDALNAVLVDLADPRIPATVREAAKVPLPEGAARTIPFQYATVGGTLALGRLDVGDAWPVALRYQALEGPRRAYQQAVARLLEQCRSHRLTPEAVEAVGAAAKDLGLAGGRRDPAVQPGLPAGGPAVHRLAGAVGSGLDADDLRRGPARRTRRLPGGHDRGPGGPDAAVQPPLRAYGGPRGTRALSGALPVAGRAAEALDAAVGAGTKRGRRAAPLPRSGWRPTTRNWAAGGRGPRDPEVRVSSPPVRLTSRGGRVTWSLKGTTMTLARPVREALWIDSCTLSRDGSTYKGTNQNGAESRGRQDAEASVDPATGVPPAAAVAMPRGGATGGRALEARPGDAGGPVDLGVPRRRYAGVRATGRRHSDGGPAREVGSSSGRRVTT